MKSEELCVAKINNVSGTQCDVELIFNGAMNIVKETIMVDVAAHVERFEGTDEESGLTIESTIQVGEAGYKPFLDKLKEMYPQVLMIDDATFDAIVAMQKQQAADLGVRSDN